MSRPVETVPLPTQAAGGFPNLGLALDYLFSSFVSRHAIHRGRRDSEFRRPEVLMGLARKLGVLPSPSRTCIVTGSKGKGTVSRMLAWNLPAAGARVGLVLTPEEIGHLDRIRVGGEPIPEQDFCRILAALRPLLDAALDNQPEDFYFAPTGLFLLVALVWFQEQGVDTWVIEGGRGARFDEIGQLDAELGVITNVLAEHVGRLGPTVEDIAADKLSLAGRCRSLVLGGSAQAWRHLLPEAYRNVHLAAVGHGPSDRPQWLGELDGIARLAAQHFHPGLPWRPFDTPAFFFARGGLDGGTAKPGTVCCDAAIHPDCLDSGFLRRTGLARGAAVIGLSDDKDGAGLAARLAEAGFGHFYTIGLSSRVGHIRAWDAGGATIKQIAVLEVTGHAQAGLPELLEGLANRHGSLYVVGVQMFIRSLRHALNVGLSYPR